MPSGPTIGVFVVVVALFAAAPGPSNMYIAARGLQLGRKAALLTALGCCVGGFCYVLATAAGLGAVLARSTGVLVALHFLGGSYLLFLGVRAVRTVRNGSPTETTVAPLATGPARTVARGAFVQVSNPKFALFLLAVFPAFVKPERGSTGTQVLVLGAAQCVVGLASDSIYAVAFGTLGRHLRLRQRMVRAGGVVSAAVYLTLSGWAFWSGARARTSP